jgi:phenylacetate-CoA ligase
MGRHDHSRRALGAFPFFPGFPMSIPETIRFTSRTIYRARNLHASPTKIARLQEKRLRRLLTSAVEHSRFYRDKFRGIDVSRCRLKELPITTKTEMMERFDDLITDPAIRRMELERFMENPDNVGRLFLGRYPVCHTSGSLGRSLLIVQNLQTIELMLGFQMTRGNVGYRVGPVEAIRRLFKPGRIMVLVNRPGFYPSACVFHQIPEPLRAFIRFSFAAGSDPDIV